MTILLDQSNLTPSHKIPSLELKILQAKKTTVLHEQDQGC